MQNYLLIQGAMEEETKVLIQALDNPQEMTLGVCEYTVGTLMDYPVVISRTRIGMTNAAVSTALAIEHFKPIAIINQGTAGGHDPDLHTGDIVLGQEVINIGAFETQYIKQGQGMHPATWEMRESEVFNPESNAWEYTKRFKANKQLFEIARSVADTYKQHKVVAGVIGSADLWNKEIDRIIWMNQVLKTSAEEMEAAAVAHVAYNYHIPYLCIRILSNNEMHEEVFDPTTGVACQEFVLEVAKAYIKDYLI